MNHTVTMVVTHATCHDMNHTVMMVVTHAHDMNHAVMMVVTQAGFLDVILPNMVSYHSM